MFKSSAKDLSPLILELTYSTQWHVVTFWYDVGNRINPHAIVITFRDLEEVEILLLSSMDSDLEAFSHNPTDDSFAPLAVQPRAITKYPTQRFLSYYVELLLQQRAILISRVKLTCLTTV